MEAGKTAASTPRLCRREKWLRAREAGKAGEDGRGSEILRECSNLLYLSRYLTKVLQKYIIFIGFS
ncbi:hypothetical protein L3476_14125 [Paenibacillus thiaminolyticus]|uniref:hypothetical protein n=1 Tax=Paenibacillus thiaminolyticus TaxID=49283 RepID=UPI001164A1CF|nr:hypothetical protein [Paenibacillus thiaminolyticus]MDG0871796.1 hypothetical protein [Paenibacillus thiaminolyticus]NGP61922.1 hypothetical protein [Paenibacillus thiaminolyticus]WCR29757.1 hypothetical protein L3476_14125 [Paenibacillus thiaminolyticus]